MIIKTVTTKSGINQVKFRDTDDRYYWIKNKGDNSILVSTEHPDTLAEGEGITEVEPGEITLVENYGNIIYINGESEVEIREQDIPMCPFKASQKGGDMAAEGDVSAEGDVIQLDGLQGDVPFSEVIMDVNLSEMNLITFPFVDADKVKNGIQFYVDYYNNSITTVGVAESETIFVVNDDIKLKPETTYTLSEEFCRNDYQTDGVRLYINIYDADNNKVAFFYTERDTNPHGRTFTTSQRAVRGEVVIRIEKDFPKDGFNPSIMPELVFGDTAPESYPIPNQAGGVMINVHNKNRIMQPYPSGSMSFEDGAGNPDGLTVTNNHDGTITVNGYANQEIDYEILRCQDIEMYMAEVGQTFMLSGCPIDDEIEDPDEWRYNYRLYMKSYDDRRDQYGDEYYDYGAGVKVSREDSYVKYISIGLHLNMGEYNNVTFRPQLELGNAVTTFEPCGRSYNIIPDTSHYIVPTDIYQLDGTNIVEVFGNGEPTLSVKGVKSNAAIKKIWDKFKTLEAEILTSEET